MSAADPRYKEELVRAMRRLSRVPRTTAETRDQLRERELPPAWVRGIVAELREHGFLDDKRFAQDYARARIERGYGPGRVRKELADKGIAEDLVESAAGALGADYDEAVCLRDALSKRLRVQGGPQTPRELRNLNDYLVRRGFSPELVRGELEEFYENILGRNI